MGKLSLFFSSKVENIFSFPSKQLSIHVTVPDLYPAFFPASLFLYLYIYIYIYIYIAVLDCHVFSDPKSGNLEAHFALTRDW